MEEIETRRRKEKINDSSNIERLFANRLFSISVTKAYNVHYVEAAIGRRLLSI